MEEATKDAVDRATRKVERGAKKVETFLGDVAETLAAGSGHHSRRKRHNAPPAGTSRSKEESERVRHKGDTVIREERPRGILKNGKSDPSQSENEKGDASEAKSGASKAVVAEERPNAATAPPPPATNRKEETDAAERPKMVRMQPQRAAQNTNMDPSKSILANKTKKPSRASIFSGVSTEMVLTVYTAIISMYHAYTCKSEILENRFPGSVVIILVVAAFLVGYNMDGFVSLFEKKERPLAKSKGDLRRPRLRRGTNVSVARRRGGMYEASPPAVPASYAEETSERPSSADEEIDEDETDDGKRFSRTRNFLRRGKTRVKRGSSRELFFSNLHHHDLAEWEAKMTAPFVEGDLMRHLLKYSDFSKRKREGRNRRVSTIEEEEGAVDTSEVVAGEEEAVVIEEAKSLTMGHALNAKDSNVRAESLESDEAWSHLMVDPMCELRGMDFFLTDDPEEHIWRQPLLEECGLRDAPTVISNMMMPFGNLTTYFKLPDWFDDWSNIPEEKEDDPSEVKALKRFLAGDEEYRNKRAKIVPYVVDGPLAIRLIKPAPMEVDIDGPRHPSKWTNVPKSVDPQTGRTNHALLEVDIDLLSERTIRRVINLIRSSLSSMTVDLAFIVSKPKHSEVEEPSACLGLWRIDKVDFESCAVFPEKTVDETAQELKLMLSQMEEVREEEIVVAVAAG